jgi:RNA polymerase sigma factor (sigma-70 family)
MRHSSHDEDRVLVAACLSGSQDAWTDFYRRFFRVVLHTVKRQRWFSPQDVEDVVQLVFLSLISALKTYGHAYSLSRFVSMVADRVSMGEYRKHRTLKRTGVTEPVEHHDDNAGTRVIVSEANHPEDEFCAAEAMNMLRQAFRGLGDRCKELLHKRYHDENSYKELTEVFGASENTLTVRMRRCLDELRGLYEELSRKGAPS